MFIEWTKSLEKQSEFSEITTGTCKKNKISNIKEIENVVFESGIFDVIGVISANFTYNVYGTYKL